MENEFVISPAWKPTYRNCSICAFEQLKGKTLLEIGRHGDDELFFYTGCGKIYCMFHDQDCCEYVRIEDICGDLDDLIGSPIILAEEVSNHEDDGNSGDSITWTFYKLSTIKGSITIRWYGSSNGYYSESVSFTLRNNEAI